MISIEELKQKFTSKNIPPYGDCIIIPAAEFDPDWEHYLADQNYACVHTDFDQRKVTLIKLKPKLAPEPKPEPISEPKLKPEGEDKPAIEPKKRKGTWLPEEDELIITNWKRGMITPEIYKVVHEKFPSRTEHAVENRISRLQKAGKIRAHWRRGEGKRKKPKEPEKTGIASEEPPKPTDRETPTFTAKTLKIEYGDIRVEVPVNERSMKLVRGVLSWLLEHEFKETSS